MKIHVIDTETTGLDPAADRVVEIAAVTLADDHDGGEWAIEDYNSSFVNPRRPIGFEAMGIHHITESDVADAPDLGPSLDLVLTDLWRESVDVVAAHNARFDRDMLPPLKNKRWIDTYRCALHLWPDAPNFKNCTLFYWRGMTRPDDVAPHRALFDAIITANLLILMLKGRSVDELLKLSTKASVLRKVGFGKHVGKLWTEVPTDYLQWGDRQDFDPDVKFTIKSELARRTHH